MNTKETTRNIEFSFSGILFPNALNVQKKLNESFNTKYMQKWARKYLLQLIKGNYALCTIHSEPTEEPGAGFSRRWGAL